MDGRGAVLDLLLTYLSLTSATFQLFYGRCNTLFPVKLVYIVANAIFALGSLVCAVAPNSIALIAGRAIAGVGVAGIMSGNVLIIAASAPLERRASLTGMMFAFLGVASVVGPFVGGSLTDKATWRWCFGINLPISALIIASTILFVKTKRDAAKTSMSIKDKIAEFDIPGTVILTASFFCLIFALQLGNSATWNDRRVIALFTLFGVLLLAYIGMSAFLKRRAEPAMQNYNVWLTSVYAGCISGGMFVPVTYMPVYFQAVRGATAFRSGVMITPLIVSFVVMSIISGGLTELIGYYNPAMILGTILSAIGAGLLTTIDPQTRTPSWIGYQILYGFGAGAGVPPPMLVIQTVLPEKDVPMGVAIVSLSQMLWSSVLVALAQAVFESKLKSGIIGLMPGIDYEKVMGAGAKDLMKVFTPAQLLIVLPIYSRGIATTFYIVVALSCLALPCALAIRWQSMKKKPTPGQEVEPKSSH